MENLSALLCTVVVIGCALFGSPRVWRSPHGVTGNAAAGTRPAPAQTDFKPNAAFREYAARRLGVAPAEVEGGAVDAAGAMSTAESVGRAWAFTMWVKSDRRREVRGWATPDGTVIAPEQNLGLLFAEAGVWAAVRDRRRDSELAAKLAQLIVWSYGMNNLVERWSDAGPPSLELNAAGDGRLRFISSYRTPGGDSFAGGPRTYTENLVALTTDRKAILTRAPYRRKFDHDDGAGAASLPLSEEGDAWLIELTRSGGMLPVKETFSLNSAGELSLIREMMMGGRVTVECSRKERLPTRDLPGIRAAVRSARPSAWRKDYNDPQHPICCDQPTTRVKLSRRVAKGQAQDYTASWYPGSYEVMATDLKALSSFIQPLWDAAHARCTSK